MGGKRILINNLFMALSYTASNFTKVGGIAIKALKGPRRRFLCSGRGRVPSLCYKAL